MTNLNATASQLKSPKDLRTPLLQSGLLRQEQKEAADWLLKHNRTALWMMPGLGKTLATLAALQVLWRGKSATRILVVAPKRVCTLVWPEELSKWGLDTEIPLTSVSGAPKTRLKRLDNGPGIYTLTYELLPWLQLHAGGVEQFDLVIMDESSKMKSASSKRFKAIKKPIHKVEWVWQLTGTPSPNGLLGIWSQVHMIDGGERLGKFITHYKDRYFTSDYMGYNWECKDPERVYAATEGLVYSLRNTKYRDLITQVKVPTQVTGEYKEMKRDGMTGPALAPVVAQSKASQLNKMRQLSNGFVYDSPDGEERVTHQYHTHKLDATRDLLSELQGDPILIFYEYQQDRDLYKEKLKLPVFSEELVKDWNAGKIPAMLISPWSAGHGLNLQGAGNKVLWLSPPYDLEVHEQANARVARGGQSSSQVVAYYLCGHGTIDHDVLELLEEKDITQDQLMRALEKKF